MDLLGPTTNSIDCDTNLTSQHDGVQKVISAMNHDPFLAHYNPYTTKLEKQWQYSTTITLKNLF